MGGKFHNPVGDKRSGSFSSVSLPGVYAVTVACDLPRAHSAGVPSADLAFPMSARHKIHHPPALRWVQNPQ